MNKHIKNFLDFSKKRKIELLKESKEEASKWYGTDSDKEISLEEYHLLVKENGEGEYDVIYKYGEDQYAYHHSSDELVNNIVDGKEWADEKSLERFFDFVGMNKEEWKEMRFVNKLSDLIQYYGAENILGTTYSYDDKKWVFNEVGIDFEDETNESKVNESVIHINDIYRIMNGIDVPQSLVNAMVKKVKEETGKKLTNMYSDAQIAEEIVKYITTEFLKVESIPVSVFIGGEEEKEEEEQAPAPTEAPTETDTTSEQPETTEEAPTEAPVEPTEETPAVDAPVEQETNKEEFEEPKEETELPK